MRTLLFVTTLLLAGCASEPTTEPIPACYNPVIYVQFHEHPDRPRALGDHVAPQDVILDPEWPPIICLPDKRSR